MSKKYEHINFVPPQSVANAAKKGLEYRKRAGGKGGLDVSEAKSEGIGSGVQRAVNLKNRDKVSPDTIKRMKAFFDRHQKNKKIESGKKPHEDRGYVAWLLWGGDPGYSWAKKVVKQMETADKREKSAKKIVYSYLQSQSPENPTQKPTQQNQRYIKEYNIHDIKTGQIVGGPYKSASKARARNIAEKKNMEYGAHRYTVQPVFESDTNLKTAAERVVTSFLKKGQKNKEKEAIDFSEINSLIQPGKSLNNRELARAIRLSISAEHDAVHLYELIADSTTNVFVRKIMQDVANEEKVHVGEFEKLLSVIDVEDTEFIEEGKNEVEEIMTEEPDVPVFVQEPTHTALR